MPWSDAIPQFTLVAAIVGFVLLGYAAVGEPLLGWRAYRWLERWRSADSRALTRCYTLTLAVQWGWTGAIATLVAVTPLAAGDLGLRLPHSLVPLLAGAAAFAVAIGAATLLARGPKRGLVPAAQPEAAPLPDTATATGAFPLPDAFPPPRAAAAPPSPASSAVVVLAPHTRSERRLALGVAVTAGICEELLYRGFLVALGVGFGLPWWAAAVLSCVLFALAHAYQGWWGLVGPGLLGVLYMVLYLGTGSLVVPIVAHILIDVSMVLTTGKGRRHRAL